LVGVAAALGAGAEDEVAVIGEPAGVGSGVAAGDAVIDAEVPAKRALGTSRMVRRAAREMRPPTRRVWCIGVPP
jgi:hypothetical protein